MTVRVLYLVVCVVVLGPSRAHATPEAEVLILAVEPASPSPEIVESIRIQLGGTATVEIGPSLHGATLEMRLSEASDFLAARGATLAIWLELETTDGGAEELVLYAVGRHRDIALVKVARMPALTGADRDRAMALKTAEFLDAILAGDATPLPPPSVPITPPEPEPSAPSAPSAPPSPLLIYTPTAPLDAPAGWDGVVELGGEVNQRQQAALTVAGGLRRSYGCWLVEAIGRFALPAERQSWAARGTVRMTERTVGAIVRVHRQLRRVSAGGHARAHLRMLDAFGTAPDGRTGDTRRWVPSAGIGAEVRLRLTSRTSAQVAASLDTALIDQRFAIDDMTVLEVGRVDATIAVTIVLSM